jgi:hypothetical protein
MGGQPGNIPAPAAPLGPTAGGSGGGGVIQLAVPSAKYPGSAPGATVTTVGDYKILTYTGSGTYNT